MHNGWRMYFANVAGGSLLISLHSLLYLEFLEFTPRDIYFLIFYSPTALSNYFFFFWITESLAHHSYVLFSKFPPLHIVSYWNTYICTLCTEVFFILKALVSFCPGLVSDWSVVNQINQPQGSSGTKSVFLCERCQC